MTQLFSVINRMTVVFFLTFLSFKSNSQSTAVNFDGANGYVSLPTSVAVSQLNTFTVEAWVYWDGTDNGCIYSETIQGNDNPMFSIIPRSTDGGGIELVLRDNAMAGLVLQPAAATVAANTWVHVAVVRTSATNIKTYINGILKDDATFTAPTSWTPNQVNAGIRWRSSQEDFFAGKMDELRIWNTARTPAEIRANMFNKNLSNSAGGLVAYYKMNEGSGSTLANSSTNTTGIDGTLANGPTWSASPIHFGGNTLHFDQADDRVLAPLATTATSNVTMEFWLNQEGGTGTDHLLLSNGVMGTDGYALYINTQRKLCVQFNAVGVWNTNYVLTPNVWTHIALVINTTGFVVYVNGANVYSNTATPITPTGSFILGFNTVAGGQPFDGMMDEVRVWNTARTQAEIQNNKNAEIDPSTPGLALYYTFNQGNPSGDNSGLVTLMDQTGNGNDGTLTNFALSGATSNFLMQNSNLFILPLQWLSFTAKRQNTGILLQWNTASETTTNGFVIEHSTEGKDWKSEGSVRSNNSTGIHGYQYTDAAPVPGVNYYRIRENDIDGSFSYSEIRNVMWGNGKNDPRVLVNPVVAKTLELQVNGPGKKLVSLISSEGRMIWKKELVPGTHRIDLAPLPKGNYFLQSGIWSQKLILP